MSNPDPHYQDPDPGESLYDGSAMDKKIKEICERMESNLLLVIATCAEASYFIRTGAQVMAGVRIKHAKKILDCIATWEEPKNGG